jgi:hypothetical protein
VIDFLTSLLERSFTPVAAIRPRTASVFEPVRVQGLPAHDVADRGEQEIFVEESPLRADRTVAIRPFPDAPPRERRPSPRPLDAPQIQPVSTSPSTAPPPHVVPRARPADEHRNAKPPALERLPDPNQAVGPRLRTPEAARSGEDAAPAERAVSIAAPRTFERVAEQSLVVPTTIGARIAADLRAATPNSDIGTRHRDTRIEHVTSNNASPTEPTVHVTIGRIDVRAVTETKVSARPQAASPVMGLDDYLRAHAKRGDR